MSVAGAVSAGAQTASTFYGFGGASAGDGDEPTALIQAQDGNFYGITSYGGNATGCADDNNISTGCGTIFRISPTGSEAVLYKFPGAVGGATPNKYGGIPSSLIQGPDGNIYGTTLVGGLAQQPALSCAGSSGATVPCCVDSNNNAVGCGTIFEFSPTQAASITPNILYTFSGTTDGGAPGNLILGTNGSLSPVIYGTTLSCSNCDFTSASGQFDPNSGGTVFSIMPSGIIPAIPTPIVSFLTPGTSLAFPNSLVQANQNTFYGTAQMGGGSCLNDLGCGGIFQISSSGASSSIQDLWYFSGNVSPTPAAAKVAANPAVQKRSARPSPQTVVAQSGSRFPVVFPFDFSPAPISLVMDNAGDVYGTTPPVCLMEDTVDGNNTAQYLPISNCNTSSSSYLAELQGSIFQLVPPSSGSSLNIPYTFSGNGPSPQTPPLDGGGSIAGVMLATDGNFYGLSGDGATTGELFTLQVQNQSITEYARLNPSFTPNSMIQGADGNFYGTSSAEYAGISCGLPCGPPPHFYGTVFEVVPPAPLQPPVQLSFSQSPITLGQSSKLAWTVPNANSLTSQQCFPFIEGTNASTAGNWSQASMRPATSILDGVLSGSLSLAPTAEGNYTYTLTCGGIVSGLATLQVSAPPPLTISPTTLPGATAGIAYSVTLTPGGGSGSSYQFSITSGSESLAVLGLNFSAGAGVISGTPPGTGTASFTVELADSLGDTFSRSYTLTVNSVTAPYSFEGAASGDGNGPTMLIQAQDGNFYGITSFGGGGGANCVNNAGSSDGCGTIFRFTPGGTKDTVLHSFTGGADGGIPNSIIQGQDGNIYVATMIGGPDSATSNPNSTALNICTDPNTSDAEPCCIHSYFSSGSLTSSPAACGAIFEFNPSQAAPLTLNPLYTFTGGTDGASPGTLILGSTGSEAEVIFGTTLACSYCGSNSSGQEFGDNAGFNIFGTAFDFVPSGSTAVTPTTIVTFPHSFTPNFSLAYPNSLIQSGTDTLYGTTQMGGDTNITLEPQNPPSPTTPCPANSNDGFGCGGVFEVSITEKTVAELCDFGDNSCLPPVTVADEPVSASLKSPERFSPETVVAQSGARFPVGGNSWSYTTLPIALTIDSSGSIYGTTPPGCAVGSTYSPNPNCTGTDPNGNSAFEVSSVFKMVPPASAGSSGTLDTLYSFTGNNDGGGTEAGLILAADGNFYGASGAGSSTSEVFAATSSGISSYAALNVAYTPTWLIQGSDGNLYGTSLSGGSGFGAFFQVKPPTPLPLPVQLSFANSSINLGSTATLTWNVPNAFSLSSQQCYPFVQANQTGAGTWSAPGSGSNSEGVYSNSATITPTKTGTFNYAVTCGGVVSGYVSLTVSYPPLSISPTSLPAGAAETLYSETLTPGGGSGTGYQFSITAGSASLTALGLSLSTAGVISGTPTAGGIATFTVQLIDSLNDSITQAYTLSVNRVMPIITWSPASTIIHGGAGSNVLNASANTSGTFTYSATPTAGGSPINITGGTATLAVGSYNLTANFTPTNTAVYDSAQSTATLLVSGESVWIVDGTGGLSELAGDGYGITTSADPGANLGVAIDSSGNVWTVGSGSTLLEETNQAGASLATISSGTGGLNSPAAIAIDGNGQIWIVDGDNSVSLFSNAGAALSPSTGFTGAPLSTPSGIAVDLSGSVWITNKGSNSVTRILGAAAPAAPLSTAAANQTTGEKP